MVYRIDLSGLSPKATIHDLTRRFAPCLSLKLAHWSPDVRLRVSYARKTNFIKCLKKMKKNKVGLTIVKQTPIPQKTKKRKRRKLSTPPKRQIRLYRRRVKDAKLAVLGLKRTVPRIRRRRLTLSREVVALSKNKYKISKRKRSIKPIDAAKRRMKRALDIARLDGVLNWRENEPRRERNTKFWRSRQKKSAIL